MDFPSSLELELDSVGISFCSVYGLGPACKFRMKLMMFSVDSYNSKHYAMSVIINIYCDVFAKGALQINGYNCDVI